MERKEFGLALRRERERRGISLEAVAESTKIGLALLTGLERGDLARWPSGIFRRAFIRAYADAIGLVPDEVVARFERVCPEGEDGAVPPPSVERHVASADPLRLTLAGSPRETARAIAVRAAAVLVDGLVVTAGGLGVAAASGQPATLAALVVGACYFALGTLGLECSPAMWAVRRATRPRPVAPGHADATASETFAPQAEASARRTDLPANVRPSARERRHVRAERRRVARSTTRPQ